jgi:hypothetical protein
MSLNQSAILLIVFPSPMACPRVGRMDGEIDVVGYGTRDSAGKRNEWSKYLLLLFSSGVIDPNSMH